MANELAVNLEAAKRSLIGTLVGDSLGLPYEGLAAGRNLRLMPFPLRQRICFGRGFASDDTLQSVFVLQSLIESGNNEDRFVNGFARRLRKWFLSGPPGIGLSTIKSCARLCLGVNPRRSGVVSAGNGAAMRAAVLGAAFCDNEEQRVRFVEISCRVTHTHPLAIQGAQIIALAASLSARNLGDDFESRAKALCPEWPWDTRCPERGPSGWVVHSVNAAIDLWRKHPDDHFEAMEAAVALGGDTDSVAAMLGGILGADPEIGWPEQWLQVCGWPRAGDIWDISTRTSYFRLVCNHAFQLPIVLAYGFRRLLPPY